MINCKTRLKRIISSFLCFGVLSMNMAVSPIVTAAETVTTKITVNPSQVLNEISPGVFGTNHRYFQSGVGMWNTVSNSVYAKFEENFEDVGLKAIRYPGGSTANLFWWKRAIGPVESRVAQVEPYLGNAPDMPYYGVDEAMRFSEKHGLKTIYVYNQGNGNAKDAAELVEYLNSPNDGKHPMAALRAANGHPAPYNVKDFELGNETYYPQAPQGSQAHWMTGTSDKTKEQLYVHGGTVKFTDQNVVMQSDFRDTAALSDGTANQVKYAKYGVPVDPDPTNSVVAVKVWDARYVTTKDLWGRDVQSLEKYNSPEVWTRVNNLAGAGKANVYTLNNDTGEIRFGDGTNGNIPAAGKLITITYSTTHDGMEAYIREMKKVDPEIKIYASYNSEDCLKELGTTVDYDGMVTHPYSLFVNEPYDTNNVAPYYYATLVDAQKGVDDVKTLQANLLKYSGRNLQAVVTEYAQHNSEMKPDPTSPTKTALYFEGALGSALHAANQLMSFIDMNMKWALRHSLIDKSFENRSINPAAFFDTYTFLPSSHAQLFKVFTHMTGKYKVESSIINNPIRTASVTGSDNKTKEDKQINKLITVASKDDDGTTYLTVVNQDATDNVMSQIQLFKYRAESAEVWTLNASSLKDYNTVNKPDNVKITYSTLDIGASSYVYSFPAHSVTAFKFKGHKYSSDNHSNVESSVSSSVGPSVISTPENAISQPVNSNTGSAVVNPSVGGSISAGDKASVTIPAGALTGSENVSVNVQVASQTSSTPQNRVLVSDVYDLSIGDAKSYKFNQPVTITLAYDPSALQAGDVPAIYYYDSASEQWINIGGVVSDSSISVQVDHFTRFAVFAATSKSAVTVNDISGHWAASNIKNLIEKGIIEGYPDKSFRPDNQITRAEFIKILVSAFKLDGKSGKTFEDIKGHWAKSYVETANAYGIANGYNESNFGPDDLITREQMVVMVVKAAKLGSTVEDIAFNDKDSISSWAKEAISTARKSGIIGGYSDNSFKPQNNSTRAEAVTVIVKALDLNRQIGK